jgi:hypothetical protein
LAGQGVFILRNGVTDGTKTNQQDKTTEAEATGICCGNGGE